MQNSLQTDSLGMSLSRIVRANCVADGWRAFCQALEKYGFDIAFYGASRLNPNENLGAGGTLVLLHAPDDYAEPFLSEGHHLRSLTFKWALQNEGFVDWQEALRQVRVHPNPHQIELNAINERYGVESGFMGGLNSIVPGTSGAISITRSTGLRHRETKKLWDEVGEAVTLLCQTMHMRVSSLPQEGVFQPLTTRQLEVLYWYAEGKMVQDISTIMSISCGTVEKHLRMARIALEADTTAHAVRKATSLNLLTA